MAIAVAAVVSILVLIVIFAVAKGFLRFSVKAIPHEFGNGAFEQVLDIFHAGHVAFQQKCPNLVPAILIFWRAYFPTQDKSSA